MDRTQAGLSVDRPRACGANQLSSTPPTPPRAYQYVLLDALRRPLARRCVPATVVHARPRHSPIPPPSARSPRARPVALAPTVVKSLRVTYTRRNPYNSRSNAIKMVKTPGGRMAGHYVKKAAKGPRCGDCGVTLPGVSALCMCAAACRRPARPVRLPRPPAPLSRICAPGWRVCARCGTAIPQARSVRSPHFARACAANALAAMLLVCALPVGM